MILYNPTPAQEHRLRVEYAQSPAYDHYAWTAYQDYVLEYVPGVAAVGMRDDDAPDTISTLGFAEEQFLTWFIMRYS